jgi:hypothetical protein
MATRELAARRLANWGQTPETRCADIDAAMALIKRAGIVTHYKASDELPNLLDAYTGSPNTKVQSEWDSSTGHVYAWRWLLGRRKAGFYSAVVLKRPTWVSWSLLPAVLRPRGDSRALDEIYDAGDLSAGAYRIACALEQAGAPMSTGDLRRAAGFPTGKGERNAYLRAMVELDSRLLVAKAFSEGDEDMRHVLTGVLCPEAVAEAATLTRAGALREVLSRYLSQAVYAVPEALAKALGLTKAEVCEGLEALARNGRS